MLGREAEFRETHNLMTFFNDESFYILNGVHILNWIAGRSLARAACSLAASLPCVSWMLRPGAGGVSRHAEAERAFIRSI